MNWYIAKVLHITYHEFIPQLQILCTHSRPVVLKMKETIQIPGVKEICSSDNLNRDFGHCLLDQLGTAEEQRRKKHGTSTHR